MLLSELVGTQLLLFLYPIMIDSNKIKLPAIRNQHLLGILCNQHLLIF